MKFYYDEITSNNKKKENHEALPFEFCKKIIEIINKLTLLYKRIIFFSCILIILLISLSFNFLFWKKDHSTPWDYALSNNFIYYFLFLYEKNLSGIFFFILLIIFIVYPKKTNLIKLAEGNAFIIVERISFGFYTSFCYLIYAQFCVFIIYFHITYMNLFLNSMGLFFIIFSFSLINTALFELPLRGFIKSFMNKNLEERFQHIYNYYSQDNVENNQEKVL